MGFRFVVIVISFLYSLMRPLVGVSLIGLVVFILVSGSLSVSPLGPLVVSFACCVLLLQCCKGFFIVSQHKHILFVFVADMESLARTE